MCVCLVVCVVTSGISTLFFMLFFHVYANMQHISVRKRFVVFLISILNWKEKNADGIRLLMERFVGLF